MACNFEIETEREDDGRWIAEIPELPGVMAYGAARDEAIRSVEALALRTPADKLEFSKEKIADPLAPVHKALLRIGWEVKRTSVARMFSSRILLAANSLGLFMTQLRSVPRCLPALPSRPD